MHPWTFGWEALVAIGTLALAAGAFFQLLAFNWSERRRTQPVAIAHEESGGELDRIRVFLTNEGTGTAFNVRFGVRLDGREYAVGGGRGRRYTVGAGERLPPQEYLELEVPPTAYLPTNPLLEWGGDERRVYWVRYENAFGKIWETANPADPLADLAIFPSSRWRRRLHDRRQRFRRWWHDLVVNRRMAALRDAIREGEDLEDEDRPRR